MDLLTDEEKSRVKLVLVGSCRNEEDHQRVEDYRRLSKHFSLENHTEFYINVEFDELKRLLGESTIGLHTMWNEHFGISMELLASFLFNLKIFLHCVYITFQIMFRYCGMHGIRSNNGCTQIRRPYDGHNHS